TEYTHDRKAEESQQEDGSERPAEHLFHESIKDPLFPITCYLHCSNGKSVLINGNNCWEVSEIEVWCFLSVYCVSAEGRNYPKVLI
ncbi:hypothetical protein scyTo_0011624, partial [Scyliorhinus torazame]|nr:hypothetical protein [Scyliorhinus torazame]